MTQNEKIKRHLERYGYITPMDAMNDYGIMRLASRINELRKAGEKIVSRNTKSVNRFGEPVHYAVYFREA